MTLRYVLGSLGARDEYDSCLSHLLTFNWRCALSAKSAQDMKALGISMATLENMSLIVLEWGHRAWRESCDATWIHMH